MSDLKKDYYSEEEYDDYDDYDDYLDDELNENDMWDNATGGIQVIDWLRLLIHMFDRLYQTIQ